MQFNLEIKTPCSENFNNFSPTQKGGFCNSCQKEVIDFSAMSSEEVIQFFKENKSTKTCGKFAKHQLEQTYSYLPKKISRRYFTGIGLAFLALFSSNVQAQETKEKTEISPKKPVETGFVEHEFIVNGNVSDRMGGLPFVTIFFKDKIAGTETDFEGNFKIRVKKGDVLVFSFVGLENKEITILNKHSVKNVVLDEYPQLLGEVTTKKVFKSKKSFWKK